MPDPRDPRPCRFCGAALTYDGWDLVHTSGRGEGSDPADDPLHLIATGQHPAMKRPNLDCNCAPDESGVIVHNSWAHTDAQWDALKPKHWPEPRSEG